ncbi:YbjQ family protein [Candidatus Manganitrophus noduliformans]|uniref:YbjQ family protein n=1 Tax=Candidatus Manganitrophus noduliformans TaxID=2606439 RepID=A0A7X6DTN7_9BACT|nr:heavy metal-binding domain-containing protein [Candidatus Manganitrophus noduliformans]NKE72843.1 YbjQ family protein [Candidatus Manganitrophus noduliformans]
MNGEILIATVDLLDGYRVESYNGLVTAHVSCGINFMRGWFVAFRDFFGGRVGTFEKESARLEERATAEMIRKASEHPGVNAILGLRLSYHHVGDGKRSMLILHAVGTKCRVRQAE